MNRKLEKYRLIKELKKEMSTSYWQAWRQCEYVEWLREKLNMPKYKGIKMDGYSSILTYKINE